MLFRVKEQRKFFLDHVLVTFLSDNVGRVIAALQCSGLLEVSEGDLCRAQLGVAVVLGQDDDSWCSAAINALHD